MNLRSFGSRLWPKTLAGQLVLLILGAVILTHVVLGFLLAEERRDAVLTERRGGALARVAAISRVLAATPSENWRDVLKVGQSPQSVMRLVEQPDADLPMSDISNMLSARLNQALDGPAVPARVHILSEDDCREVEAREKDDRKKHHDDDDVRDGDRDHVREKDWKKSWGRYYPSHIGPRFFDHLDCVEAPLMQISVPIFPSGGSGAQSGPAASSGSGDGSGLNAPDVVLPVVWLEARINGMAPPPRVVLANILRVAISTLLIGIIAYFLARRMTRSWAVLAQAADRVGRGDYPEPVPENGPIEIRRAAKAFNRMTARLKRFVEDRTRMLAAISHDLRTPITSLRLRAEFVEDGENRARIIETLNEMEQMVEAAMTFAREETANEKTRKIDITALTEAIVEDLMETGHPIRFHGDGASRVYPCRPLSIKRALGNLISNALTFGDLVEVSLKPADDGGIWIEISDDGPGIPPEQRDQVFEPFFRLETSRNRETGGIGLGLAIARTAIRAHGGEIYLEDAPAGGLLARIYLPPIAH
ncbi:ATP-binding protein [Thalassospira alkalitolerans]|uniref:ATP-binding protein n=1 Tax=Thalassospira alkalitolerans TaxID=1293890 RepID=UPI003AA9AA43